jgi:hypothetical protein
VCCCSYKTACYSVYLVLLFLQNCLLLLSILCCCSYKTARYFCLSCAVVLTKLPATLSILSHITRNSAHALPPYFFRSVFNHHCTVLAKSDYYLNHVRPSVRPSVHTKQRESHLKHCRQISCLEFVLTFVDSPFLVKPRSVILKTHVQLCYWSL